MSSSFGGLYHLAQNGMLSRQLDMDGISNNVANIHTPGYKQMRTNFQEMLNENELSGTSAVCSQANPNQGDLVISNNPMDWAISGPGFFGIKLPDGTLGYTRDGTFSLDNSGNIVTGGGYKLDWTGTVPADADMVNVEPNGTISARVAGVWAEAGTLKLTIFNNPTGLNSYGSNIWKESDNSGTAQTGVPGEEDFGQVHGIYN